MLFHNNEKRNQVFTQFKNAFDILVAVVVFVFPTWNLPLPLLLRLLPMSYVFVTCLNLKFQSSDKNNNKTQSSCLSVTKLTYFIVPKKRTDRYTQRDKHNFCWKTRRPPLSWPPPRRQAKGGKMRNKWKNRKREKKSKCHTELGHTWMTKKCFFLLRGDEGSGWRRQGMTTNGITPLGKWWRKTKQKFIYKICWNEFFMDLTFSWNERQRLIMRIDVKDICWCKSRSKETFS